MVERQGSTPSNKEKILSEEFNGFYGRVLFATNRLNEFEEIIDPTIPIAIGQAAINLEFPRDYNQITKNLSTEERTRAWKDFESFDQAYSAWKQRLVSSINTTDDEKRIDAVQIITGKNSKEFKDDDAKIVYETWCSGKSDTTLFVQNVVSNLSPDGNFDKQRFEITKSHIEWFASQLFGKNTAEAVVRIIELEANIKIKKTSALKEIYSNKNEIIKPKGKDFELLFKLRYGLNAQPISTSETSEGENAQPQTQNATVDQPSEQVEINAQDDTNPAEETIFPAPAARKNSPSVRNGTKIRTYAEKPKIEGAILIKSTGTDFRDEIRSVLTNLENETASLLVPLQPLHEHQMSRYKNGSSGGKTIIDDEKNTASFKGIRADLGGIPVRVNVDYKNRRQDGQLTIRHSVYRIDNGSKVKQGEFTSVYPDEIKWIFDENFTKDNPLWQPISAELVGKNILLRLKKRTEAFTV